MLLAAARDPRSREVNHGTFCLLIEAGVATGQDAFPMNTPGIASVLAARALVPIAAEDRRLAVCLSRIYELLHSSDRELVCRVLEISGDDWIARTEQNRRNLNRSVGPSAQPSPGDEQKMLLLLLERLVVYLESYISYVAPVERALQQYQLGLEVTLPASREQIAGGRETDLQKELCKFLIERNVLAVGTVFGSSEIDLLTQQGPINVVVETKIYKSRPGPAMIRKNIAQLQRYMSQQVVAARGVLLIYNLSDKTILSERRWLEGQIWVLAVNLPAKRPSELTKSILVKPGSGSDLVGFIENDTAALSKKTSKKKTSKKKTSKKKTSKKKASKKT